MSNVEYRAKPSGWVGWIAFAAIVLVIVGAFNAIQGLAAILKDDIYVVGKEATLVLDVTAWGWVHLIWGIFLFVTGIFLFRGALWATTTAAILVIFNAILQMMMLPAYPIFSLVIITLDMLVLWALVVHGGDERIGDLNRGVSNDHGGTGNIRGSNPGY